MAMACMHSMGHGTWDMGYGVCTYLYGMEEKKEEKKQSRGWPVTASSVVEWRLRKMQEKMDGLAKTCKAGRTAARQGMTAGRNPAPNPRSPNPPKPGLEGGLQGYWAGLGQGCGQGCGRASAPPSTSLRVPSRNVPRAKRLRPSDMPHPDALQTGGCSLSRLTFARLRSCSDSRQRG